MWRPALVHKRCNPLSKIQPYLLRSFQPIWGIAWMWAWLLWIPKLWNFQGSLQWEVELKLELPIFQTYPKKLALTSPTSGGRSVGIVRSRTQATEFSFESSSIPVSKCCIILISTWNSCIVSEIYLKAPNSSSIESACMTNIKHLAHFMCWTVATCSYQ
jgi:hypothetical protein